MRTYHNVKMVILSLLLIETSALLDLLLVLPLLRVQNEHLSGRAVTTIREESGPIMATPQSKIPRWGEKLGLDL